MTRRHGLHISKKTIGMVAWSIVWLVLLLYVFRTQVFALEARWGFGDRPLGPGSILLVFGLALVPLFWLPKRLLRPSDYALWYLYVATVAAVPIVSYMSGAPQESELTSLSELLFYSTIAIGAHGIMTLCARLAPRIPTFKLNPRRVRTYASVVFAVLGIVAAYLWYVYGSIVTFNLLDHVSIYDQRRHARTVVSDARGLGYIMSFLKAVPPLAIGMAFHWRAKWLIGVGLIAGITIFAFNATKASILTPVSLVILGVAIHHTRAGTRGMSASRVGQVLTVICLLSIAVFVFLGDYTFTATGLRRAVIIPAHVFQLYIDFFLEHPYALMTDSIFSFASRPIYDLPVPLELGRHYYGTAELAYNTGIIPSAFAHFGLAGVFVTAVLTGTVFGVMDTLGPETRNTLGVLTAFFLAQIWGAQALHTSMLSSGVGPLLLGYYFLAVRRRPGAASAEPVRESRR